MVQCIEYFQLFKGEKWFFFSQKSPIGGPEAKKYYLYFFHQIGGGVTFLMETFHYRIFFVICFLQRHFLPFAVSSRKGSILGHGICNIMILSVHVYVCVNVNLWPPLFSTLLYKYLPYLQQRLWLTYPGDQLVKLWPSYREQTSH